MKTLIIISLINKIGYYEEPCHVTKCGLMDWEGSDNIIRKEEEYILIVFMKYIYKLDRIYRERSWLLKL